MMFINSIFLPKTISDQTIPEGISNGIGNFSHLFSNVFHIVKDETEFNSTKTIQLENVLSESVEATQNEFLNVSLFADNKINLSSTNISQMISAFLSKLSQKQSNSKPVGIVNSNNNNIPQYFSLNKNELIKEIQNIIESFKNGESTNLENVEISLIANGNSIRISKETTNLTELHNWISEQVQLSSDFEIVVKSGKQNPIVNAEPINYEIKQILKEHKSNDIISVSTDETGEPKNIVKNGKNNENQNIIIDQFAESQTELEQPIIGTKQPKIIPNQNSPANYISNSQTQVNNIIGNSPNILSKDKIVSSDFVISEIKNNINQKSNLLETPTPKLVTEKNEKLNNIIVNPDEVETEIQTNSTLKIDAEVNSKIKNAAQNISKIVSPKLSTPITSLKTEVSSENQKVIISNSEINNISESASSNNNNLNFSETNSEKKVKSSLKNPNTEVKVNTDVSQTDPTFKNKKVTEVIKTVSEFSIKEEGKTEPKINIKSNKKINSVLLNKNSIQENVSFNDLLKNTAVKDININSQSFIKKNELKTDINSTKIQTSKNDSTVLDSVINKNNFANQKIKTQTDKSVIKTQTVNFDNNPNKVIEASKVKNTNKMSFQQELFVTDNSVDVDANVRSKSEYYKTTDNFQQTDKTISVNKAIKNIPNEIKTKEQVEPVIIDSKNHKTQSLIKSNTDSSSAKENIVSNSNEKIESIKNSSEVTIKENTFISKPKMELEIKQVFSKTLVAENKNEQVISETKTKQSSSNEPLDSLKEINKDSVKHSAKKVEINLSAASEKTLSASKARTNIESIRTSLNENKNVEIKSEVTPINQPQNKNVKVDLMQRRVFSQIPHLEVIAENSEIQTAKNLKLNIDTNKTENVQLNDELIKTSPNSVDQKPTIEKQVWVKVSLEKNDIDASNNEKKPIQQQNKITIDLNSDEMKKDFQQNKFAEKDSNEFQQSKSQPKNANSEVTNTTEQKPAIQNQSTLNQQDITSNLKPDIKVEQNTFKTTIQNEEVKFSSRSAEMVEKVKIISAGEMVREIHKVFENGEKQSIVLRLVPKELGSIKVMLDTIENVLTAKVEVENETVGNIVKNNVEQLKQNLLQSGVNVGSINIFQHGADQKQNGLHNQKRKNAAYLKNSDTEEVDETIITKKMGYNTYEYLA